MILRCNFNSSARNSGIAANFETLSVTSTLRIASVISVSTANNRGSSGSTTNRKGDDLSAFRTELASDKSF